MAILGQELQVKEKEYEAKLQSSEDANRQKVFELRDMITVQQRMSAKYVNIRFQKLVSAPKLLWYILTWTSSLNMLNYSQSVDFFE